MGPGFVVVGRVVAKYTSQMLLVEHDDVVGAFVPDSTDRALG